MKKKTLTCLAVAIFVTAGSVIKAQDLCSSNPGHCKLLADSAGVKMMLITLPPGARLNNHTHPINMGYVIKGGLYKWTYTDGKTEQAEMKPGEHFLGGPEDTHYSWNAGKTTIEFVLVEKKE